MELHLVRHAIAFGRDGNEWPDDSLRPLTPEGVERFRKTARGLRRVVPAVDAVLTSPYTRAWQTAEILEQEAGWPAPTRREELGADGPPGGALRLLERMEPSSVVALVGHEPNLSSLASLLLTGRDDEVLLEMKKGGVACLRWDGGVRPGDASLRWLLSPKILLSARS